MKTLGILRELPQLFRYADVQKFTANANVFLTRALAKELVSRVARGVYVNSFLRGFPPVEELGCFLRAPSYISCEWALNRHGATLQAPTFCTVITLSTAVGESRNLGYQGITLEFAHISDRLFTGYEMREGFNLAVPEKALLDTIYLRKSIPFRGELELEVFNPERLRTLAEAFPAPTRHLVAEIFGS